MGDLPLSVLRLGAVRRSEFPLPDLVGAHIGSAHPTEMDQAVSSGAYLPLMASNTASGGRSL